MKAAVLSEIAPIERWPIRLLDLPEPSPAPDELLLKVLACGLCRTELDEIEGRLPVPKLPRVLGHQVVGRVIQKGPGVRTVEVGARVGVTWLWKSCGRCSFCAAGFENLCSSALWTGLDVDGGYAEYMTVPADFAHPLPAGLDDLHTAPLLCAGVIGFRALRLARIQDGQIVGLFGFGASAHLCIQILKARFPAGKVYVFTRSSGHRRLAEQLGADWTGLPEDNPPACQNRQGDRLYPRRPDCTPGLEPASEGRKTPHQRHLQTNPHPPDGLCRTPLVRTFHSKHRQRYTGRRR